MNEVEVDSHQLECTLSCIKQEILSRGKPVFIVSDIDDTLANTYHYDSQRQIHVPHISGNLITHAQHLQRPLLLATGRPNTDPVVASVWLLLSKPILPIIVENGGAIFHPTTNDIQVLITSEQTKLLNKAKKLVLQKISSTLSISHDDEIHIDKSRLTSIEIRIQNHITKVGSSIVHTEAAKILQDSFDPSQLVAISSGSSVSIHTPDISKGVATLAVLSQLGVQRTEITLLALGDNHNDSSLFSIADISVGVGKDTFGQAQFVCPFGETTSAAILKLIAECDI
jgi:hydroxymethylpyrimidine pyrophosphatase-like HAD family hydrolase